MKEDIVHFYVPQIKVPFYMEMAGISYCDSLPQEIEVILELKQIFTLQKMESLL